MLRFCQSSAALGFGFVVDFECDMEIIQERLRVSLT
jgi:translation elongation factor EF-4